MQIGHSSPLAIQKIKNKDTVPENLGGGMVKV